MCQLTIVSEKEETRPLTNTIATNGFTIYAPEGTTLEEICQEFETNEDLWAKVTNHKLQTHYRGPGPREWVLTCVPKDIVYTKGRDKEKIRHRMKEQITCECGRVVTRGELSKHKKTIIHRQCSK